ncbi:MAG: hypothetical protein ACKO2P_01385 [Planctomycetota bacterium]
MSDALSEALMKLAAAKPVAGSRLPPAAPVTAAVIAETVAAVSDPPASATGDSRAPADIAEPQAHPAIAAAFARMANTQSTAAPVPVPPAASAMDFMVRIRELRGWVAAGIALAVLVTVVDDLRHHGKAHPDAELTASAVEDVNLDELLREFETAEPSARPQRSRAAEMEPVVDVDPESEVTADYGDTQRESADERAVSGAGAGVVRFSGRIEPLR